MRYLQGQGHEVTIVVFRVGKGIQVPEGIRLIHVRLSWVPKPLRAYVFDQRLERILAHEKFDFVLSLGRTSHQHALLLPGNHLGFMRAMGKRFKTLDDRLQIMMDARAYAAPGVILACSEMMRDEVVEMYGVNPLKIKVLYPPSDPHRFHQGHRNHRAELRARFGMHPDKVACVLVSASHGRKGLPLLLQVFHALREEPYELLVAGEEEVEAMGLDNVRGLGFVKETELLYAAADCTLLPARYEPYGQVVSESLMCGTPVMISEQVGAKSVVGVGEGMVLPDLKVETWVEAVRRLRHQQYTIPEDFAERHGITLEAHMQVILDCKQEVQDSPPGARP